MAGFDLDHTSTGTGGRLQRRVDCSLGYDEFITSMMYGEDNDVKISGAPFTAFKTMWEERGLTEDAYNTYKSAGCDENHPQCSDSDTVFDDGEASCKSRDCRCVKQSGSGSGSIQTQSSNSEKVDTTVVDPKRVLAAVGLGMVVILGIQYYQVSKEKV